LGTGAVQIPDEPEPEYTHCTPGSQPTLFPFTIPQACPTPTVGMATASAHVPDAHTCGHAQYSVQASPFVGKGAHLFATQVKPTLHVVGDEHATPTSPYSTQTTWLGLHAPIAGSQMSGLLHCPLGGSHVTIGLQDPPSAT